MEKQWVVEINEDLKRLPDPSQESAHWRKRSIYRIPASVTDVNQRAYKPQIVSFGPYHHDQEHLRPMEEHKRRALLHFLKRSDQPLQSFLDALAPVVEDLRDAYEQLDPKWLQDDRPVPSILWALGSALQDDDKFLRLMIVDGCFMLEILRAAATAAAHSQAGGPRPPPPAPPHAEARTEIQQAAEEHAVENDYAGNDPIFSYHGKLYIVPFLKRDMLMLENQLPILVLEKLVSVQKDKSLKNREDLTRRILDFFQPSVLVFNFQMFDECLHILEVYRKILLHVQPKRKPISKPKGVDDAAASSCLHQGGGGSEEIIRSATELNEAGIRIEKSKSRSLRDISFHRGVLKLPLIVVDDALESLYLNLIAFERFHVGAGNEITSYIFFMDNIIDSARDVSLLHTCGIIQNALGSDKAVANLFNSLSKDVTLDPKSSLGVVHKDVSAYCQKAWNRWRANLMHTYFTNPWAILSVIAAVFLFALTIVQSLYSVLSYVRPHP